MTDPSTAPTVLDREFLVMRSRLVDLAAALDRVDRAGSPSDDPRLAALRRGIELLLDGGTGPRAERVLRVFSLDYDPDWRRGYGL